MVTQCVDLGAQSVNHRLLTVHQPAQIVCELEQWDVLSLGGKI